MRGLPYFLAFLPSVCASRPDIRADTNRDGVVDIKGQSDSYNKAVWSPKNGAIFLPNVGDKHMRCANTDRNGEPLSNDELAYCSDASGHLLLAPEYLAPLRTLPINVSATATGRVYATPRAAYDRVRIFFSEDGSNSSAWRLVDQERTFSSELLAKGLTLGIDGRELSKDASVWDGSVTVVFEVSDDTQVDMDAVALKMAPVLTHHHLQKVETLVSTAANDTEPIQQNFLKELDEARVVSGLERPLLLFNQSDDIWAQDFLEPAYASMPGPEGKPIAIRIMLRSAQSTRAAGRQIFEQLRGPGVGGFQPPSDTGSGFGHREINSFGNLETIPPYTSKSGVKYKAGRIIMGKHFERKPAKALLDFLSAQGLQTPLLLEAGWLAIGHVDEFVQFLPYDNELGFTISIADTRSAFDILQKVKKDGHGNVAAISFKGDADEPGLGDSVDMMLANSTFVTVNEYAQKHIDANLQTLLSEIPLDPKDVIYVPTLFRAFDLGGGGFWAPSDGLPSHGDDAMENEWLLAAFHPASINGIVIGNHYVSPKPFGPIIDGVDVLARGVESAYAKAGMNVTYVDDFLSHHMNGGEVHCGSNTLRQTDMIWWE
ncbi:hypothetical protein BHE90_015281 [Fusarium euwallaceae]|uniref:Protein-arginine deiminase C-terminal domain-containing protein n=1 Tax=Fusarium euwallaceae TaxID=1147111 RepID=A0A430L3J9_9HYPO|nr:hypothetical protein BHE90_015281 [Fusarium euwallaceae]